MVIKEEIEILNNFKKKHPWSGTYCQKKIKFKKLLTELCELHDVEVPKLLIPSKKFEWTKKRHGDCTYQSKKIRIRNFSVITLLHEFRHWLDFCKFPTLIQRKEKKKVEWRANYYSSRLFYTVWPERIKIFKRLAKNNQLIKNSTKLKRLRISYKNNANLKISSRAGMCALVDVLLDEKC